MFGPAMALAQVSWEFAQEFSQAALSVFALANPVGGLPNLVSITEDIPTAERRPLLRLAGVIALGVICAMALVGQVLLRYVFNIRIEEFAFAGGLVLVIVGMQRILSSGQKHRLPEPQSPEERRQVQLSLAVSPLAMPLLVGPGSIVNVMLLADQHGRLFAVGACVAAFAAVILILNYSHIVYRLMGRLGALAVGRVLQVFIVAIGVKFCFRALSAAFPALLK